MINMRGLEFESLTCKIITLIARSCNNLITTLKSLAYILEEPEDKVKKELIYMSKQGLIGMRVIDGTCKILKNEVKGKYLKLNIKQYNKSLIMIAPQLYFTGEVSEQ